MALNYTHIAPFLHTSQNRVSRWLGYVGLGVGVVLLLLSIQLFININTLLKEKNPRKNGYDYISVTKLITNDNMGADHSFSPADVEALKQAPGIEDATPLQANKFLVRASGSSMLPFTTDLFLEAIDKKFLDTLPAAFHWQPGQNTVPIIISSDYLELYNTVFAPAKDLPQFSEQSISLVTVQLECYAADGRVQTFKANVAGLSDRINSVLVPQNFLEWANQQLGSKNAANPSRVFIKTKDANNASLLQFLQDHKYSVNKDKTQFGRVKQVLQAIVGGLSGFGVLVILLAMLLFSFYLQLMIARSQQNLQLLLTLGYSPAWLSKTVAKRWIPVYAMIVLFALLFTAAFQWYFQQVAMNGKEGLSPIVSWLVMLTAVLLLLLSVFINYRIVKRLLLKL